MGGRVLRGRVEIDHARAAFFRGTGQRIRTHPVLIALDHLEAPLQHPRGMQQPGIDQRLAQNRVTGVGQRQQQGGQRSLRAFRDDQGVGIHLAEDRLEPLLCGPVICPASAAHVIGHQVADVTAGQHR
ncbi:hypothetical protein D3C71_1347520 [compost metagenome]